MHQGFTSFLCATTVAVGIAGGAATPADAQQSGWRRPACVAFTKHVNARDWAWVDRHSSAQALRVVKRERQRSRFDFVGSYSTGPNSVECDYASVLVVDMTRRASGLVYADSAYWQD